MKLCVIRGSAYARIAQVVCLEKGIEGRVDVVAAQTHVADSAYCAICPSCRVPNLGCRATWSSWCLGPDNTQVQHAFDGARWSRYRHARAPHGDGRGTPGERPNLHIALPNAKANQPTMNTDQRFEVSPRPAVAPVRQALHWQVVSALLVSALAVSVAALQEQEAEQPKLASPVAAPAPYVSPYPAPQVDPSAPPQEPAPTF